MSSNIPDFCKMTQDERRTVFDEIIIKHVTGHNQDITVKVQEQRTKFIENGVFLTSSVTNSNNNCVFCLDQLVFNCSSCKAVDTHERRNTELKEALAKFVNERKGKTMDKKSENQNEEKPTRKKRTLKEKLVKTTKQGLLRTATKKITQGSRNVLQNALEAHNIPALNAASSMLNTPAGESALGGLMALVAHFLPDKIGNNEYLELIQEELFINSSQAVSNEVYDNLLAPFANVIAEQVALFAQGMQALEAPSTKALPIFNESEDEE